MARINNDFSSNNALKKIRSKYIITKVFDNLNENKLLNIIHYNKIYQKMMKIKLKDYKNQFSKIEIEIIPEKNIYDNFINVANKIIKENVHIYFNNDKEEIKRSLITKDDNVTKIKIIINHKIKSLSKFFQDCKCIKKLNFIKFNKDDIIDMNMMFYGCSSLKELNLSNFNTNNVTDMSGLFKGCSSLKKLDISNFNTNNVTDLNSMFKGCSSLKILDLFNFKANNTINISSMFEGCSS